MTAATTTMRTRSPPELHHQVVRIQAIRVNDDALETRKFNGRDHLVVPSIILVEGVLHSSNADHPALALAEEFGKAPQGWDGRPIMFDHPKIDGEPVSANSPDIWEGQVIGQLFGTMVKNSTKLKTDLWLDKERTPTEVFDTLDSGESLEVSTGLYVQEEEGKGTFNGKEYDTIWRNIVPDHLAVLPKGHVGACSVQDGCGAPRANKERTNSMQPPKGCHQPTGPRNDAAVPPKQDEALCSCESCVAKRAKSTQNAAKEADLTSNMAKILSNFLVSIGLKTQELSDKDKAIALEAALSQAEEGEPFYVLAIFSDKVVYACLDTMDYSWHTYSRTYSVAEGGVVTLGAESGEVRPETQYVPLVVAINASGDPEQAQPPKGNDMQTPEQIAEAARLAALAGAMAAPPVVASATALPGVGTPAPASIPVVPAAPVKATSLETLAEHADEATKKQLEALLKDQKDRKEALIKALEGKTGLDTAQHQAMPISVLEAMAKKLNPTAQIDFSGAAGAPPAQNANGDKDPGYVAAEQVFPIKDGRVEMPAAAGKH